MATHLGPILSCTLPASIVKAAKTAMVIEKVKTTSSECQPNFSIRAD
ncbi:hypothetical protein N752_24760 [Desulforamulus aquiferis]|nr:hypothetical protein N752_24760 [Desulforamulus aquiferis]